MSGRSGAGAKGDSCPIVSGRLSNRQQPQQPREPAQRRLPAGRLSRLTGALLLLVVAQLAYPLHASADSTGEKSPTSTTGGFSGGTPPGSNAFACDNVNLAQATANNQTQTYSVYGLSVPANAIVTGIQVRVRANDGTKNNRKLQVSLSWNGGTTFTSTLNTRNFRRNAPLRDFIVGGAAVLWGRTWVPSEFSDGNFQLKLNARMPGGVGSDLINLDCIPVTVFYQIPGAPNLNISKTDSPDPVQPLQNITYTITYSNTGESTATNVIISDNTPINTTFVSASPAPASAPSVGGTGTVTWNIGSVPVGGSGAVTLVVQVDSGLSNGTQILNDTYSIAGDQNPSTAGNSVATTVQGTIALTLGKSDAPDPVAEGGTLTYVLTIGNSGNVPSTNIVVNEQYDGNVGFDSFSSTCNLQGGGGPDTWTILSLAAGASCTITITTTVNSPLADGVLLSNAADIIDDALNSAEAAAVTTVDNPAVCGDGVIKAPEECDEAAANGTSGSCCTATCTFRASSQVCRPAADECDAAETCSGASATCPADDFVTAGVGCTDDGNVCTDDACNGAGLCIHPNNTAPCNDGSACTTNDTCGGGACTGGPPPNCNDGNDCTDDGCDPDLGCTNVNNNDPCNDGSFCTTADACSGGTCVGGPPPNCNDGNVCTDDSCNIGSGCAHTSNSEPCSDGDACTTNDTCSGGSCASGPAANCDDGNTCTSDSCVSPTGCQHPAIGGCCNTNGDCADTDQCTTNEHCVSHACASSPVNCDDNNGCTDDSCNPTSGCANVDNNAGCNDNDACTTADSCSGGSCVGGPAPNCNDNNVCTDDDCNIGSGCTHTGNTAPCDDGSFCTGPDTCSGSSCGGGPAPDCDDNNVCTVDSCIPASGCTHPAGNAGTQCRAQNGDCDLAETCNGASTTCPVDGYASPSTECRATAGECDVAEHCTGSGPDCPANGFQPNDMSCTDDSVFCDGVETCQNGVCQSSGVPCTGLQSCDEATQTCFQGFCPANAVACRTGAKARLLIREKGGDGTRDKLVWKLTKGMATSQMDLADPTATADYALCFYTGPASDLIGQSNVPPGNLWSPLSTRGYRYKDAAGTADGIQRILVKGSTQSKSKALAKGKGAGLPDIALPIESSDLPLVVQLRNNQTGICFEGSFATPRRNQSDQFNAKTP